MNVAYFDKGFFYLTPIFDVKLEFPPINIILRHCLLHKENLKKLRKIRGVTLKALDIAPHFYLIL